MKSNKKNERRPHPATALGVKRDLVSDLSACTKHAIHNTCTYVHIY